MVTKQVGLHRRALLGVGFSAVAGAAISCRTTASSSAWRFFTDDEARTVEAITAQLIPSGLPSGPGPGAKEAGVVNYIDIQLSRRFRKHQKAYRDGLAAANATSLKTAGKRFVDLAGEQQIEVLNSLEENAKPFFQLILAHTRQGFYGDPRHGGNRNMVSWKMLGLPFPPLRGRQHYDGVKAG
jgi:gluconate 2-dehydrogenase gamma chain